MSKHIETQLIIITTLLVSGIFITVIPLNLVHAEEAGVTVSANASVSNEGQLTPAQIRERLQAELRAKANATTTTGQGQSTTTLRAEAQAKAEARLEQAVANIVKKRVLTVMRRLNAALDRLTKIADRLDSRIQKIEAKGVKLDNAKKLVVDSRFAIASAQTMVSGIPSAVQAVVTSDRPGESFKEVRNIISQAEDNVKKAHKALVEAVIAVKVAAGAKKIEVDDAVTATTTTNQ